MLISTILPTFNRAYCLSRAIESVLAQTYSNWELIVVDDGSTDETSAVLETFRDPRIRVIRHGANRGVAAARNTGLAATGGEIIAFIDSDDVWKPDKLARQIEFLRLHPDVPIVFSDVTWRCGPDQVSSVARSLPVFSKLLKESPASRNYLIIPRRSMYLYLLEEFPIRMPAVVAHRDVFQRVGSFNESMPSGEDWEFFIRAARHFSCGYVDQPVAEIHVLPDATHFRYAVQDKTRLVSVLRSEARAAGADGEVRAAVRRGIIMLYKHLYWHYVSRQFRLEAAKYCLRGFAVTRDSGLLARAGWVLVKPLRPA